MGIPCHGGGYGHQFPEASHSWETGLLFYHYATGSPEAREALEQMADFRWKNGTLDGYNYKPNCWRYNGRNAAWQIHGMIAHFDLTGDRKWLDHAEHGFGVLQKRLSPAGTFGSRSSYQLGTFLAAAGRYWEFTGSEAAKKLHLRVLDFFVRKNRSGDWYSPWLIDGYAYGHRMTGEAKLLELAKGAYQNVFRKPAFGKDGQRFRTGTASVKTWSNSTRNAQPLLWLLERQGR
jgi:hypothetical protein